MKVNFFFYPDHFRIRSVLCSLLLIFAVSFSAYGQEVCSCETNYNIGQGNTETLISVALPDVNSISNTCVMMHGTVIIDQNFSLDEVDLIMMPGAEIIINGSRILTVTDSRISGCDYMWKGITLKIRSRLIFTGNEISDAQYAIHVPALMSGLGNQTYLSAKNNFFNRNYASMLIENPNSGWYLDFDVNGNVYDCTSNLLPGYLNQSPAPESRSYAGWIMKVLGWPLVVGELPVTQVSESFQNLTNGVLSFGPNSRLYGCKFLNIQADVNSNYPIQGVGVYSDGFGVSVIGDGSVNFDNCHTGIRGTVTGGRIYQCNMVNVDTGIEIDYWIYGYESITDNQISCIHKGIHLNGGWSYGWQAGPYQKHIFNNIISIGVGEVTEDPKAIRIQGNMNSGAHGFEIAQNQIFSFKGEVPVGISVDHALRTKIAENTITFHNGPSGNPDNYPFGIILSNSDKTLIGCNTIQAEFSVPGFGGEGIQLINNGNVGDEFGVPPVINCNTVTNLMRGVKAIGSNPGFAFTNNVFNDYGQEGLIISYGGTLESPTGVHDNSGNQWNGTAPSWTADAKNKNPIGSAALLSSLFRVDGTSQPYYPGTVIPSTDWFLGNPQGPLAICDLQPGECGTASGNFSVTSEFDEKVANQIAFEGIQGKEVRTWLRSRQLYNKLKQNPELVTATYQAFYESAANSSIGQFEALDLAIKAGPDLNTQAAQMDALQSQLDQQLASKANIQLAMETASAGELPDLEEALEAIYLQMTATVSQLNLLQLETYAAMQNYYAGLLSENAALATSKVYEQNEQAINAIYLQTVAVNNYQFSPAQINLIDGLAHQCLFEAGEAVLIARLLYQHIEQKVFLNFDDCQSETSEKKLVGEEPAIAIEFAVAPNPAVDDLSIKSNDVITKPLTARVSNSSGIVMLNKVLSADYNEWTIGLNACSPGVYFLEILNEHSQIIHVEKFVVAK